ncbi:hypothetical protein NDU88_005029 [Pleurodeles waltl]|uniref:Uncharacterized protein n=1 Tax=Pleurodeles waltl TaxID=8319 RepID=A0AAV7NQ83_PLEWA|nr:hypothetical protein NDU88_005029 [Pleurodeles waltl]
MAFFHCRQVHQRTVHARIRPSPRKSQRTVPRKDNMEHRVRQTTGLCDAVKIKPCGPLKWRLPDLRSGTMGCEVNALAGHTVAVGGRRPLYEAALVNIEAYGFQEPMTMCAGGRGTHRRGTHRRGRDRHFLAD